MAVTMKRLMDRRLRGGKENHKRVYELLWGKKKVVLNFYINTSGEVRERYNLNVLFLKKLAEHGIPVPKLLHYQRKESTIVMEYIGEGLSSWIRIADIEQCKSAIRQVVSIIKQMGEIESKTADFVMQHSFERLSLHISNGVFQDSSEEVNESINELVSRINRLCETISGSKFVYGYGRNDSDIINFAVDEMGTVYTFDFDEARMCYDPYYQLGYFWTSIEHIGEAQRVEELREEFLECVPMDDNSTKIRFFLGAAGHMSHELWRTPWDDTFVHQKIREMYSLADYFGIRL